MTPYGLPGCKCTYDTCAGDADCPAGQTCVCHGSAYTHGQGNACYPSTCRVDADCGAGGYCSPAVSVYNCGFMAGYYCRTLDDSCANDSDCRSTMVCTLSGESGHWDCLSLPVCG